MTELNETVAREIMRGVNGRLPAREIARMVLDIPEISEALRARRAAAEDSKG